MTVPECLRELGGVARRGALVRVTSRHEVDRAVTDGEIVRFGRGRYGLPDLDDAVGLAATLGGAVSHTTAALHHGWAVLEIPDRPHITISRGRKRHPLSARARLHVAELRPDQVRDHVTEPWTTLEHCVRTLPLPAALAVADSALRDGFGSASLTRLAERARGPGSVMARTVAAEASPLAANPFESALRAICLDVRGLRVRPQVTIAEGDFTARPDLVDERLRIVLVADSFAWHGGREQLATDARRYNRLVIHGWIVLRFSWEDVMFHPDAVREVLVAAVALAEVMSKQTLRPPPAA